MRKPTFSRLLGILIATAALLAVAIPAAQAAPLKAAKPKSAWVHLSGLFQLHGHEVTLAGRSVHMVTQEAPYVPHQKVTVTVSINGHQVRRFSAFLKHGPGDKYGWLSATIRPKRAGHVTVSVQHQGDPRMTGYDVHAYYFTLSAQARPGATGWFVQLMQQRLAALHVYVRQTGVFDTQTGWALDAYHRLVSNDHSQARTFDKPIVNDLLDGVGSFHVRFPHQGRHAEGDLTDQLLALINGDKVAWILPISSGKESTPTVLGSYQIYRRVPGYLPDGMYYTDFFTGGYAIHGYDPAPDYPASHGCMRLWIDDAIPVYDWLALGDWVDSYGTAPYHLGEGDL